MKGKGKNQKADSELVEGGFSEDMENLDMEELVVQPTGGQHDLKTVMEMNSLEFKKKQKMEEYRLKAEMEFARQ